MARKKGRVSEPYAFEGNGDIDQTMELAQQKLDDLMSTPVPDLPDDIKNKIFNQFNGILTKLK